MNYQIITDEKLLKDFINWLPDLKSDETYFCALLARNKYCKDITHISTDKIQMKRFTTNKERMFEKIKQCECEVGTYKQKDIIVPQEALAMYVTVNPRSHTKGAKLLLKALADLLTKDYSHYNLHQEALTALHKSPGTKHFLDIDFDDTTPQERIQLIKTKDIINLNACSILHTRGGFHLLVKLEDIEERYQKTWYNQLMDLNPDIVGDNFIPIPGTYQGGFTPKLTSLE